MFFLKSSLKSLVNNVEEIVDKFFSSSKQRKSEIERKMLVDVVVCVNLSRGEEMEAKAIQSKGKKKRPKKNFFRLNLHSTDH